MATALDGTLGLAADLFNFETKATAGSDSDKLANGGSIFVTHYINDVYARSNDSAMVNAPLVSKSLRESKTKRIGYSMRCAEATKIDPWSIPNTNGPIISPRQPWNRGDLDQWEGSMRDHGLWTTMTLVLIPILLVGSVYFARRNFDSKRADLNGAFAVAGFAAAVVLLVCRRGAGRFGVRD